MSDDLVKRLYAAVARVSARDVSDYSVTVSGSDIMDVLSTLEFHAAEIARLRDAIATARREGMEEAARRCESPCIGDYMNAYGKYFAAAIRAEAKWGE